MLNYQRVIWFNGICVDCLLPRIGRLLNQVDQRPHLCLGLLVWPGAETLGLQMLWLGKRVDGQLMVITCHYFKSLATNGKVYKPAKACRASKITVAMIYNVFIIWLMLKLSTSSTLVAFRYTFVNMCASLCPPVAWRCQLVTVSASPEVKSWRRTARDSF